MNKKFLSAILFGALMVSSTGTFVSCKDYDDDIEDLQEQLNKKASLEELTQKVSTMESSVADAKKAAEEVTLVIHLPSLILLSKAAICDFRSFNVLSIRSMSSS